MSSNEEVLQYGINMDDVRNSISATNEYQERLYFLFAPTLGGVIFGMNLFVLLSSTLALYERKQPRSVYIFLDNIAFANILTGATAFFRQFYPMAHPSDMICCLSIGLIISSTISSVHSIGLIAIDRFYFILYGLQYKKFSSSKRALLMVLGTWLLGCALGFMPALGVRNYDDNKKLCFFITLAPTSLVLMTVSVGIMPLIMILILYGIVLKKALGKIARVSQFKLDMHLTRYFSVGSSYVSANKGGVSHVHDEPLDELQTHRSIFSFFREKNSFSLSSVLSPRRSKAMKIVLFTTFCYLITWVPYFIACTLYVFCNERNSPGYCYNLRLAIESLLAVLGLVNCLLFPFIYAWWHYEFHESAKRVFNGFRHQNQEPQISTLSWDSDLTSYTVTKKNPKNSSKKRRASEPIHMENQKYNGNWGYIDL